MKLRIVATALAVGWVPLAAAQPIAPTNVLVEPKNTRPGADGTVVVCPDESGSFVFSVLPVSYDLDDQGAIFPVAHPCGFVNDGFCQATGDLVVEVGFFPTGTADGTAGIAECGSDCTACVNLDTARGAEADCGAQREQYPAPVVRLPRRTLVRSADGVVLARITGRRTIEGSPVSEATPYNVTNRDVAFSAVLGPGLSTVPSPVVLAGESSNACQ